MSQYLYITCFWFWSHFTLAQTISGRVLDAQSREPLAGASVVASAGQRGTTVITTGYFTLQLGKNDTTVQISRVGYTLQQVSVRADTTLTILMQPVQLEAVTVRAPRSWETDFGRVSIPIERLLAVPAIGGERDIVRALTILPGVVAGNEGQASLFVRGGGSDQNLFVLDGAYLYNTGHLFNFLSLFNPDAISRVDFYKGNFPAEYGGRLSSVVDVSMREGSKTEYKGKAEIGLITSKLALEGPLLKNRSSFMLTARASYFDLFTAAKRRQFREEQGENYLGFQMSDIGAKITHEFNERHKVFLSYYQSADRYEVGSNVGSIDFSRYRLANRLVSIRYSGVLSRRFLVGASLNHTVNRSSIFNEVVNTRAVYENDQFGIPNFKGYRPVDTTSTNDLSRVSDWVGRINGVYNWRTHRLTLGAEGQYHRYLPYQFSDGDLTRQTETLAATEYALYASNEFNWLGRIRLQTGIRLSGFTSGDAQYQTAEPRISLSVSSASLGTWNVGWGRMAQYQHALMRGADFFERLVWVPSTSSVAPQLSEQWSVGWQRPLRLAERAWMLSLEGYYRDLKQLSYFNTTNFSRFRYLTWPDRLLSGGEGRAYGGELMLTKREGRLTGNLSYGLLKSERRFDALNEGRWFPFAFDRRHNLSLTAEYNLRRAWKLSGQFVYMSGRRFNLPTGRVVANPFTISYDVYENYYAGKLPDTHRLDLALSNERRTKANRQITWTFSLYNAYARANPFYAYVSRREVRMPDKPVEYTDEIKAVSMFSVVPGISFAHTF